MKQIPERDRVQGFKYQIMKLVLEFCLLPVCMINFQIILYIFDSFVIRNFSQNQIEQLIEFCSWSYSSLVLSSQILFCCEDIKNGGNVVKWRNFSTLKDYLTLKSEGICK